MSYDPNMPPPQQPQQYPYQPPGPIAYAQPNPLSYAPFGSRTLLPVLGRAKAATICFWMMLAGYVLTIPMMLSLFVFMPDLESDGPVSNTGLLLGISLIAIVFGLGFAALNVTTIVLYCMWQHRAHNNAHVLANHPLETTPGWGVGYWFIPILNLFRPYQVMREIDSATPPDSQPVGQLIGWWWTLFIATIVASAISGVLEGPSDSMTAASLGFDLLSTTTSIGGVLLILRIIRSISDRQAAVVGA